MFIISKEFPFEASHMLLNLPVEHKCSHLHGHSYVVVLTLASVGIDTRGFVIDYADMSPFKDVVDGLDHKFLVPLMARQGVSFVPAEKNSPPEMIIIKSHDFLELRLPLSSAALVDVKNTTAEELAMYLFDRATLLFGGAVRSVEVRETAKTSAVFDRGSLS